MPTVTKFLRTYQGLITSIVMILLTAIGTLVGIVPGVKRIIDIRSQSIQLTKTIQTLRTKINILESKDESTYRDEFAQLLAAVPGDKSLPTMFSTLDGLTMQTGVTLTEASLAKPGSIASGSATKRSPEEQKIESNLLPFTVTVNGSYDQIYAFLSQVNTVRRFFRVRNFDISFSDMSTISVHMGMDAFYAPIASTIGPVDSPLDPLSPSEEALITKISQLPYLGQTMMSASVQPQTTSKANLFAP